MNKSQYEILDVPVSSLDYDQISQQIMVWAQDHESRSVGVCNVHSVTSAGWDTELRNALLSNDLNTADGMPLVWMLKCLGHKTASRVYGPTLMLYLLVYARYYGLKVAFYGGHEDRLDILVENLRQRYEGLEIVEAISPPFGYLDGETEEAYIAQLKEADPHLLFVGLGCPKQEIWMKEHKSDLNAVMIGVGAAFDFHANAVPQAPSSLQKLGLEWLFRLYQEPRRLAVRYFTTNPIFVFRGAFQLLMTWLGRVGERYEWGKQTGSISGQ